MINIAWFRCAKFNLTASYLRSRSSKLALQGKHSFKIESMNFSSTETTVFKNILQHHLPNSPNRNTHRRGDLALL